MAAIKSVARSATVGFAPTAPDLLATGTMAGAFDLAFSTSASLDVFKVDFSNPDPELPMINSFAASERFNRLSWGSTAAGSDEYPYGVIAGGLTDGSIGLWNPAPLISQDNGLNIENSLLAKLQKHSGQVRGLEFNVITPNLLASGGDDGEIYIWDLVNPSSPSCYPPLKIGGSGGQQEIAYLSWNRKVQHILASTSHSGASVVWDLKRQKPALSFTDPHSRRRCSVLQWNPDVATQLIVASDDDRSPALQVWDLRNSVSPVKELVGHTKGVLAMAWCPIDSALLLTCAKDNRTLCWDTLSGEIICELPVSSNWNFDVQWSPRIAGVLSTSSFDGRVNIYNIEACSRTLPSEGVFGGGISAGSASASMRAPKWLKRPAGVTFGFGGKLVSFGLKKTTAGASGPLSELKIQTVITEEDLVKRSEEFEATIADPSNRVSMQALCERKAELSRSEAEKEVWNFLRVMFEDNARTALLSHLGFLMPRSVNGVVQEKGDPVEDIQAEMTEKLTLINGAVEKGQDDSGLPNVPLLELQRELNDDGLDFFNNLSTPKGTVSPQIVPRPEKEAADSMVLWEDEQDGVNEEDDCDRAVQHALVIGDFKEAVEQCLSANRMADALVLAHIGGPELWERTLIEHMRKNSRPYRKVMAAVVAHDIGDLVRTRPLKAWKETLALLCSYAGSEDWSMLCDALAARLDAAGLADAAILCYICAANTEDVVKIWYRDLLSNQSGVIFVNHLQDLMEKTIVLTLAKGEKLVSGTLARLVGCYIELLSNEGLLTTAMEYLSLLPSDEASQEVLIIKDRVYNSRKAENVKTETFGYPPALQDTFTTSGVEPSYVAAQTSPLQAPMESSYPPYPPQESVYPPSETVYGTADNTYQAQPQPGIFFPTMPTSQFLQPPPSMPQQSFAPPPVTSFTPENPPKSFTPVNPPTSFTPVNPPTMSNSSVPPLSNQFFMAGQDITNNRFLNPATFQPPSMASQRTPNMMFPGPANPPIVAAPTPGGFVPISTARAPLTQQQPTMLTPAMQPQSPSSMSTSLQQQPASPASIAPPTIQNVDTTNVAADLKTVISTLSRLYNETSEALGGVRANPVKKREIDDNSRKLGTLFAKLNSADISPNARSKLIQLCQSLDGGDHATALQIQVGLTTSDWDECGFWLAALKRMIKTRQTLR